MRDRVKNLILLAVLFTFASCASVADKVLDPVKVKVPDVSVKSMKLTEAILNVTISVMNPNGVSATVKKLNYDVMIGDKSVAKGVYVKDVVVAANKTTTVVIPVTVSNGDLIAFLAKVLLTKGTPYRAQGEVHVGPLSIPFDEKGMITSKDL